MVVVDDDDSVRESLPDLLKMLGYESKGFASAEEFLASGVAVTASCMILDIGLPKMSGHQLQRELIRRGNRRPVIFITGRAEKSLPPGLLSQGVPCLLKPFSEEALSTALHAVLRQI